MFPQNLPTSIEVGSPPYRGTGNLHAISVGNYDLFTPLGPLPLADSTPYVWRNTFQGVGNTRSGLIEFVARLPRSFYVTQLQAFPGNGIANGTTNGIVPAG
jgi:hypothetical protein